VRIGSYPGLFSSGLHLFVDLYMVCVFVCCLNHIPSCLFVHIAFVVFCSYGICVCLSVCIPSVCICFHWVCVCLYCLSVCLYCIRICFFISHSCLFVCRYTLSLRLSVRIVFVCLYVLCVYLFVPIHGCRERS